MASGKKVVRRRADRIRTDDLVVIGERRMAVTRVEKSKANNADQQYPHVTIYTQERGGMHFRDNAKVKVVLGG